MWPFSKKKGDSSQNNDPSNSNRQNGNTPQHYNFKNKLFPISKPMGYSPQHVEEAIMQYTKVIENQKIVIAKIREDLAYYRDRCNQLDAANKNLLLQLSFTQAPDMSQIQEDYISKKFQEKFQQGSLRSDREVYEDYSDDRSTEEILQECSVSTPPNTGFSSIDNRLQRNKCKTENLNPGVSDLFESTSSTEEQQSVTPIKLNINKKPTPVVEEPVDENFINEDDFEFSEENNLDDDIDLGFESDDSEEHKPDVDVDIDDDMQDDEDSEFSFDEDSVINRANDSKPKDFSIEDLNSEEFESEESGDDFDFDFDDNESESQNEGKLESKNDKKDNDGDIDDFISKFGF